MKTENDEMKAEYTRAELGKGVRGKYDAAYRKSSNIVLLSPDVAAEFPNEKAVNTALRALIKKRRKSG